MPTIISGLIARDGLKKSLAAKIKILQEKRNLSVSPSPLILAIIQVGDRADSAAYINAKKRFATEIGVNVKIVNLGENVLQEKIIAEIQKLNQDNEVTGIIVQLPLPKNMDEQVILDAVDPAKDADAITSTNMKEWMVRDVISYNIKMSSRTNQCPTLYPATARGVGELLDFYKISLKRKNVCVIGRSRFVGTPIACLCRAKGAHVTVCHSKTEDLVKETLAADVIICAVGKADLITANYVREGQVVVDVGINEIVGANSDEKQDSLVKVYEVEVKDGKAKSKISTSRRIVGDVDFEKVKAVLGQDGAITPVPGGVGPMTVLALFENLADCAIMSS